MAESTVILTAEAIQRALTRIAHEIAERNLDSRSLALVGVQRGGVHFANRLAGLLQNIWKHPVPVGVLDVGMHRDDLDHRPSPPMHPTTIPFDITWKVVVLVD